MLQVLGVLGILVALGGAVWLQVQRLRGGRATPVPLHPTRLAALTGAPVAAALRAALFELVRRGAVVLEAAGETGAWKLRHDPEQPLEPEEEGMVRLVFGQTREIPSWLMVQKLSTDEGFVQASDWLSALEVQMRQVWDRQAPNLAGPFAFLAVVSGFFVGGPGLWLGLIVAFWLSQMGRRGQQVPTEWEQQRRLWRNYSDDLARETVPLDADGAVNWEAVQAYALNREDAVIPAGSPWFKALDLALDQVADDWHKRDR